ncbi:carboxyl transferase [Gordonia desulfuricans]|uniref:Acetyl-coenzyme A carboxylase carboxyl transferase subunits beta/alpha n=1 Tax=Gordonia desulfuricans TaxID=89051 RepID=A0A7K3LKT6_9ACTN|nr:carboxyl transferase domain-containing protein [Gordonia desulfuricans]NDK88661.1 carboxyl transferase [Gordonia desulfuricans]
MTAARLSAVELITAVVDDGTWRSWDDPGAVAAVTDRPYAEDLRRAAEKSGGDESVRTGRAEIDGVPAVLVVGDFSFLGGSIGRAAGHRITTAIRRATADRLPVLAFPCSGGTRMQEGTPAFLEMAAISAAVLDHRAAHLPYLVYLRHPTTGGVFASWGSLGQVTWAEPDALVGFLGPRVVQGLTGEPVPAGVQRSENLLRHALVDAVVPTAEVRARLAQVLGLLAGPADPRVPEPAAERIVVAESAVVESVAAQSPARGAGSAWAAVTATRLPGRPGVRALLAGGQTAILADDGPILLALSRFGSHTAVVIGQDAEVQRAGRAIGPADLRLARRGLALAKDLRLPVVTVIDTSGAELSADAEEQGVAREIAWCTAELVALPTPTVSVLAGQGAGGAALALFPADHRIAADDAWLAPLPPEGASLIVHHDTGHAAELAARQHILATELAGVGVIDTVVPAAGLRAAIGQALSDIAAPLPTARIRLPERNNGGHRPPRKGMGR